MKSNEVINWLLEEKESAVQYQVLRDLMGKDEDNPDVKAARQLMMEVPPISRILSNLNDEGHFVYKPTIEKYGDEFAACGYLPKYKATTWRLLILAQLRADTQHPTIQKMCRYVMHHCYFEEYKSFFIRDPLYMSPCFAGNMVWALCQFGFGKHPKVTEARKTLIRYARFDDGDFKTPKTWPYRGRNDRCSGRHSCYSGSLKALKAAATIPPEERDRETRKFIQRGIEFFLLHRVYQASRHPEQLLNPRVDKLTFPLLVYPDFLEILDVLLNLDVKDKRMDDAINLLKSKSLPNGRWLLDKEVSNLPTTFGKKNKENKWITIRALRVLNLISS